MSPPPSVSAAAIHQAHQLYCQLTGQTLRLAFDRERMWYDLLRAGYSLQDLHSVITYLQREIRAQRRNIGALKLSNLLQPDRFEEDLQISRVRLHSRPPTPPAPASTPSGGIESSPTTARPAARSGVSAPNQSRPALTAFPGPIPNCPHGSLRKKFSTPTR